MRANPRFSKVKRIDGNHALPGFDQRFDLRPDILSSRVRNQNRRAPGVRRRELHAKEPVILKAVGPRSSLFALIAAALQPESISSVELTGAMSSLKEVVDNNGSVDKTPELFCFGLLEHFDVPQLKALARQ